MKETMGQRIAEQRKKIGLTQNELAEKLMVSNKAVSKWESDNGNPSIEFLPELSRVLGCSIDYLISGKEFKMNFYRIPVNFDYCNKDNLSGDLCNFSHTLAYVNDRQVSELFETIKDSILNSNNSFISLFSIENLNNEDEIRKMVKEANKNLLNRQPLAVSVTNLSTHYNNYIYPASKEKPYIILLIKNFNEFLLNEEFKNYIASILEIGKACGVFVIALSNNPMRNEFANKFETIIKYNETYKNNKKCYPPVFLNQVISNTQNDCSETQNYLFPITFGYYNYENIYFDIEQNLGTLILGKNISAKNNLLHYIITQIIDNPSNSVQLALIDKKNNTFSHYTQLENLFGSTAHSNEQVNFLLKSCVDELDKRFDKLGSLNINGRNLLQDKKEMPYLIILIDELSEITDNEDNLKCIQKILQLGRACGIFMFISTDLPYEKISDHIKNNCYTTISLNSDESSSKNSVITIKTPNESYSNLKVPYLSEEYIKELANKHF